MFFACSIDVISMAHRLLVRTLDTRFLDEPPRLHLPVRQEAYGALAKNNYYETFLLY